MVDARPASIPRPVRDAAADWVERGQRTPGPAFEKALESWLASNPTHRHAYDQALSDWRASAELRDTRTGKERSLVRAPFLMRRNTHLAAAGLATAALVLVIVGRSNILPPISVVSEASAQTLKTTKGEIRTVTLADGSRVTLDTETIVQVSFTPSERRASLSRGRARFAVAPDAVRPFVVEANGREIRGGAATFDISAGAAGPIVSALTGRVEVVPQSSRSNSVITVDPGEQVDTGTMSAARRADARAAEWVSGMLVVDATPLGDAVAAMNRYSRITVRIADPEIERLTVSGAFRVTNTEEFVRSVATMYNLRIAKSADGSLTLTRAGGRLPEK